jgi:hypothetical protein
MEITPFVGAYVPTESVDPVFAAILSVASAPCSFDTAVAQRLLLRETGSPRFTTDWASARGRAGPVRQQYESLLCPNTTARPRAAPTVGARIAARLTRRFAAEFSLAYAPNAVRYASGVISSRDTSAAIVMGSAGLRVNLDQPPLKVPLYFVLGGGFVTHSGSAYSNITGRTGWGPLAGIGARVRASPALAIRAELDWSHYRFSGLAVGNRTPEEQALYPAPLEPYRSSWQNDFALSVGMSVIKP